MDTSALPMELLIHIVARVVSRQDLVHLQLACRQLCGIVLHHRERERAKLPMALVGQISFYTTANLEQLVMPHVRPLAESMIRSFLVAQLPSEQHALETLYQISWTRADLETFVLETLYGYVKPERFLQDIGATRKLRETFKADHKYSSLRRLLCEEGKFCVARGSCSGVSKRALEVCKSYEDLRQWECSLSLARTLLDGLYRECGHFAPSTKCWAEHVQRLERPKPTNEVQSCADDSL
jgi:hypothetical protein